MASGIQTFDFSVNLLQAILWQYENATSLRAILQNEQDFCDENQQNFWNDWLVNVFDLRTANSFGLGVWAIILGLPLYVNSGPSDGPLFGFDDQTGYNFDNSNFGYSDGNTYELPLEIRRVALRLRYYQLTTAGTVPEINRMLADVFADYGPAWLLDYHDMTQRYIFDFPLTYDLKYLFNNYDILPRPSGVKSDYYDNTLPYFGFAPDNSNFDNSNFGV